MHEYVCVYMQTHECMCMYVCAGMYMYVVLVEVRKLCEISWSHSYRQWAAFGCWIYTRILCKERSPLIY